MNRIKLLIALTIASALANSSWLAAEKLPDIVIFLADDLSIEDPCYTTELMFLRAAVDEWMVSLDDQSMATEYQHEPVSKQKGKQKKNRISNSYFSC